MTVVKAWKPALLLLPKGITSWEEAEARALAETAGYSIRGVVRYRRISLSKLMSDSKVREVAEKAKELGLNGYDYARIIVYDDVKPRDYFRLVRETGIQVVDRTLLILEIFSLHAGSKEAKLQIELARLKHELPLVREAIRLSKLRELPGFLGPGGYAVDAYYRFVVSRIAKIRAELLELRRRRELERVKRRSAGLPHVAIVGYASAGKTSIFNAVTGLDKPVGPEYFTTITPKRRAAIVDGVKVIFIDTVGFISRIPPEIIEAFHSTLEEAATSDVILYVLDGSEPDTVMVEKLREGIRTLRRIGVVGKPMFIAFNKVDLIPADEAERRAALAHSIAKELYPALEATVKVSAKTGEGLGEMLCRLATLLKGMEKSMF